MKTPIIPPQIQCQYEIQGPDVRCLRRVENENFCIFHIHKPTDSEKKSVSQNQLTSFNDIEERFRVEFFVLLEEEENDQSVKGHDFTGFCFPDIFFGNRTFKKAVYWYNALFNGVADFPRVTFTDDAVFREVFFADAAIFWGACFEGRADFGGSTFKRQALFEGAAFKEEVNFYYTTFSQGARFGRYKDYTVFPNKCDFGNLFLDKDSVIAFEKVNLSKASFLDTDLTGIPFRDVKWYRYDSRLKIASRKRALWDEFRPLEEGEEERDFEKIAENYRQLVLNYERKRDYDSAEDFHVGEMEMRRKTKGIGVTPTWWRKVREWTNAYGAYRILSNYGTSYVQGIIVLLLMVFLFSGFVLYSGFQPSKNSAEGAVTVIEYNVWPDSDHHTVPLHQWISDYGEATLFVLSILTFQRERFYEPVGVWSRMWVNISTIVFTGQAALVLLAIRRRFKR